MSYVEYNNNPKKLKTSDCAIRAVANAMCISWDKAYELLAIEGFKLKTEMADVKAVSSLLLNNGFQEGKIKITKGSKRPTVADFAESHPDIVCVLRVANHLVACGYGNYVDIWDSGDCSVYKYWYRPVRKGDK